MNPKFDIKMIKFKIMYFYSICILSLFVILFIKCSTSSTKSKEVENARTDLISEDTVLVENEPQIDNPDYVNSKIIVERIPINETQYIKLVDSENETEYFNFSGEILSNISITTDYIKLFKNDLKFNTKSVLVWYSKDTIWIKRNENYLGGEFELTSKKTTKKKGGSLKISFKDGVLKKDLERPETSKSIYYYSFKNDEVLIESPLKITLTKKQ